MGTVFRSKASQRTQFFRLNLTSCAVMLPLIALYPSVTHASDTESTPAVTVIETTQLVGFGEAKYPADFTHFDYVNPDAPKLGKVTYGSIGTYDSFNRFGSRGVAASYTGEIYDTLMFSPSDEIDAYYPLIASKVRYASDFTWMEIDINPKAKFNDGEPITAHDVAFTFNKFSTEGVPQYRVYYKEIKSVTAVSDLVVRIEMEKPNREKLFSFAQSTRVLPEHYWKDKKLSEPLSEPPVGSGPYKIISYKSGQSVTYGLDENYWAADLPVNVGRNNFKEVQYDYYRDDTVMLEAFKAGSSTFERKTRLSSGPTLTQARTSIKATSSKKRSTMRSQKRLKVLSSTFNLLCSQIPRFVKR